jgi:3-hydroxyisobutyrate dehydrogenase
MKAGFIGLGRLGSAIAKRLLSEGVRLTVWNRTREKAKALAVETAGTPAELLSAVDTVLVCLFDSMAVQSVLAGNGGLLECKNPGGKVIVDLTTNHFEQAERFHSIVKGFGASYLETPVLGSVVPASQGSLTVLASGEKEAYEKALPYLQKIGRKHYFLRTPGLATRVKLINNLVLGNFMASIAEALALAEESGLAKEEALDILSNGAGSSLVLDAKKDKLLSGDFSTHFSSALIYKDLHYVQDLARAMKRPLFTAGTVKELFAMTFQRGLGEMDFCAVYKVLKALGKD